MTHVASYYRSRI